MDGAIAGLGTAAIGAAFVFDFVAGSTEGTPLQVATTLAYPLGDILMVAMVVGVIALAGWRPGRTWALLLAGLSALVVADLAYTLQTTQETLPLGGWIDPIYLIAATCLGAVVWQPAEAAAISAPPEGSRRRDLIVPAVFAAVMICLFAMQYFSATSALSTILWAATITAVIVRLAMSDRENKSAARAGPHRLADRARQPRTRPGRPPGPVRRGDGRGSDLAGPPRPQRVQALQRQLRPPGRRHTADPLRRRPPRCGRVRRHRLPLRRRRVLPAPDLPPRAIRRGHRGRGPRAQRRRRRLRHQRLLGLGRDPGRGDSTPTRRSSSPTPGCTRTRSRAGRRSPSPAPGAPGRDACRLPCRDRITSDRQGHLVEEVGPCPIPISAARSTCPPAGSATGRPARGPRSSSSTDTSSTDGSGTGSSTGSPPPTAASRRTGRSAPSRSR